MSTVGIIFSNIHDKNIPELTRMRTMASVPFGCRYRFIDFTLSNMVNSDIHKIGVITQYNYQSLLDHIGTGKDWDLATRAGGIKIIPPNITAFAGTNSENFTTRMTSLKSATVFISRCKEDYVVLSDCDVICNIDLRDMINYHIDSMADITLATKTMTLSAESARKNVIVRADRRGRVKDLAVYPNDITGEHDISLNIMVMRRDFLQSVIHDAIAHGYNSFNSDVILKNIKSYNIRAYRYEGYFACVSSLTEYFACSMDLLDADVRHELFPQKNRHVLTNVRTSAPTRYASGAFVHNSLLADGCLIEGEVENSIIFRGVKICRGAVVKNSIIMQDSIISEGAKLNCMILDKNVVIRDDRVLSGHETMPFYIDKGSMV